MFALIISGIAFSQKNYISVGTGAFFKSSLADSKNMLGATVEYGRVLKNNMSIGYCFGFYSLTKDKGFSEVKLNIPIYNFGKYNISVSGGTGYFHTYNDILLEYDLNFNADLGVNYYIVFSLSKSSGLGAEYTSLNIGLTKNF